MELYKEFIKETGGRECVYNDKYFYTYIINGEVFYLENVFIKKEYRNKGIVDNIIEEAYNLAKESNCKYLTSSACLNSFKNIVERTDHILKRNGFKVYKTDDYMIDYVKGIE